MEFLKKHKLTFEEMLCLLKWLSWNVYLPVCIKVLLKQSSLPSLTLLFPILYSISRHSYWWLMYSSKHSSIQHMVISMANVLFTGSVDDSTGRVIWPSEIQIYSSITTLQLFSCQSSALLIAEPSLISSPL